MSIFRTPSTVETAKIYVAATGPALALVAVIVGLTGSAAPAVTSLASRHNSTTVTIPAARPASALARAGATSPAAIRLVSVTGERPGFRAAEQGRMAGGIDIAVGRTTASANATAAAKATAFGSGTGQQRTAPPANAHLTAQQIALRMLPMFHWPQSQFSALNLLWSRESGWNVYAANPYSGAYGIPQAVPGGKMASAGPDWRSSASTQILWGLRYIKEMYGSPSGAWAHELATGWY